MSSSVEKFRKVCWVVLRAWIHHNLLYLLKILIHLIVRTKRHSDCSRILLLVKVWVILDRPPNDPFLRKKEPFTSSLFLRFTSGRSHAGGRYLSAPSEDVKCGVQKHRSHTKKLDTVSNKRLHSLLRNVMSQAKSVKILNFEMWVDVEVGGVIGGFQYDHPL